MTHVLPALTLTMLIAPSCGSGRIPALIGLQMLTALAPMASCSKAADFCLVAAILWSFMTLSVTLPVEERFVVSQDHPLAHVAMLPASFVTADQSGSTLFMQLKKDALAFWVAFWVAFWLHTWFSGSQLFSLS